ncbi:hypothetical protein ACUNWD_01995 [Sunxiuqinia sp. A32]|uniref:hypothetical protein n=1 Tax=Sunxiuqinia sp. A32 TaxID=3461496 RepID=UPI004045441F
MTEQEQVLLDEFKAKFKLLIRKHDRLKEKNKQLTDQLHELNEELARLQGENESLVKKYDDQKLAKVFTASFAEKQEAKQKINKIVREIDKCIAQLNV